MADTHRADSQGGRGLATAAPPQRQTRRRRGWRRGLAALSLVGLAAIAPPALAQMPNRPMVPLPQQRPAWNALTVVQVSTQWLGALALLVGAGAATTGIYHYQRHCRWRRRETVRQVVDDFCSRPTVRNAIDILDYEEYRLFEVRLPDGRSRCIEVTDARLKRALRSHDEMVKTRRGLAVIVPRVAQGANVDEGIARMVQRYQDEEFPIELTLRDWFDEFLMGLERFDSMIEAGIASADAFKPFILYWIRLMGDRRFRRTGGSSFYDQLFHYIRWAGYSGVQRLFERYGYKVLPPPYSTHDFSHFEAEPGPFDAYRALCLAKAAHLVYEDGEYVRDIVSYWISDEYTEDNPWQEMKPQEYIADLMRRWSQEGQNKRLDSLIGNFYAFNEASTDTQGILFRKGKHIVLAFRGSQQVQDWRTNFSVSRRPFRTVSGKTPKDWPTGSVHRGFQGAWESVETDVLACLQDWCKGDYCLWVTGHSLGGALANLAGVSLDYQGFKVSGLYTFGQPRVADWQFVREVNQRMGDRIFRYANNNDVVPLIPPPFIPWNPTRLYGHMGEFRYFNTAGKLHMKSLPGQRWFDHLLGLVLAIREAGTDLVADHMMEFYVNHLQAALDREVKAEQSAEKATQTANLSVKAKTIDP